MFILNLDYIALIIPIRDRKIQKKKALQGKP